MTSRFVRREIVRTWIGDIANWLCEETGRAATLSESVELNSLAMPLYKADYAKWPLAEGSS